MWTVNEVHTVLQTAFQKELRRRKQRIKNKALEKQNKVVDPRFGGALFFRASLQSAAYLFTENKTHTILQNDFGLKVYYIVKTNT